MTDTQKLQSTRNPERLEVFLRMSAELEGRHLASVIPSVYYKPQVARGLLGFMVSWLLYVGAIFGTAKTPHWVFYLPLWLIAGLGAWGLHCIAHDCGHGSFSPSRRLNVVIGHLALLPLFYPFHSWQHVHNMHHSHTNNIELDTDWRPLPLSMYSRLSWWSRWVYTGTRTWAFWSGTIHYWWKSAFRPAFFPTRAMRQDVIRSIAFTALVGVLYLGLLAWKTGVYGIFLYCLMPWLFAHAWFSATTLMHHSANDVPYLTSDKWTGNTGRLLVTTDYVYPRILSFLTHNISIHTPHHVAPAIPYYNLPKAQQALKEAFPGMLRERRLKAGHLLQILCNLHLYDTDTSFYTDFSQHKIDSKAAQSSL